MFSMAIHDFISCVRIGVYMQSITIHSTCYVFMCFRRPKMEILGWWFVHSLNRSLLVPTKRLLFDNSAFPMKWMSSLCSPLCAYQFTFRTTFVIFVWLYWKSTCNMNSTFRNVGSQFHWRRETTRNMQSAHRIHMIDFMIVCVCMRACAFFVTVLFRLTSFTDYGWKLPCRCVAVVFFYLFLTRDSWMEWTHVWMNDLLYFIRIHSHFVKMAFSQVKVIFSLWIGNRANADFFAYFYDYIDMIT